SGRILPGVSAGGVALGGLSADDAEAQLAATWSQIKVRDGKREWFIPPSQLGITLDAHRTAIDARRFGREVGWFLSGVFGRETVAPVLVIDPTIAAQGIKALAPTVELPVANATIHMVNGQITPVPAVEGRLLDIPATADSLLKSASDVLAD